MSHPDANQAVPETASSTVTMCCDDFDHVDIVMPVMPHDGAAKVPDQTDASASTQGDEKDDDDKLPELISNATEYDESCTASQQVADNAEAEVTSSDTSTHTPEDHENDDKLPGGIPDVTHNIDMPSVELADNVDASVPPLVDEGDTDLYIADPSTGTMLVNDGDSDFNLADLSTNSILVDYGDLDINVANPSADTQSVDDEDSELNVVDPLRATILVDDEDSDFDAANASTDNNMFVDDGDSDLNVTNPSTNTQSFDYADSDTNVSNTSVRTQQSDDDTIPDLVPGIGVYHDLPDLVDDRDSELTISNIESTNSGSFMVHNGQRCNRKPSDCDNCKSIIEAQTQQFVQELVADCVKMNERRPESAQDLVAHSVKADENERISAQKKLEDTAEGGLHIAMSLLFLVMIGLMDNSWTTAITLLLLWHGFSVMRLTLNEAREQHRLAKNTDGNPIKAVKSQAVYQVSGIVGAVAQGLENGLEKIQFSEGTILERMRSGALDQLKGDDGSEAEKIRIEEVD